MSKNDDGSCQNTENSKITPKFQKWSDLPEEVKDEYLKAIEAEKMIDENTVKLNIGGTVFQTSKYTLMMQDGFFKTMLETGVPVAKDSFNSIFIDRSSKHFELILNFMRDGYVEFPDSKSDLIEIRKEAQFYLLDSLYSTCSLKLKKFDANWSDLPEFLKTKCIETMDLQMKSCLRCTSKTEKSLVDSMRYKLSYFCVRRGEILFGTVGGPRYQLVSRVNDPSTQIRVGKNKILHVLAYIYRSCDIERIDFSSNPGISDIEKLPELVESIRTNKFEARNLTLGPFAKTVLKLIWNEMEAVEISSCRFLPVPYDELFDFPSVKNAQKVEFYKANTDQLISIFDKWFEQNPKEGQKLTLQSESPQAATMLRNELSSRSTIATANIVTLPTNDPENFIKVNFYRLDHRCPMIFCNVFKKEKH